MTETSPSSEQPAAPPNIGGRPSSYDDEYANQAQKLCELGATDSNLADFFGVSVRTIMRWKVDFPRFCQATKTGKEAADERVINSLYHRANGYSFDAVKIFMPAGAAEPVYAPYTEHVPPDTTAAIFWLKNRRPKEWRDRIALANDPDNPLTSPEAQTRVAEALQALLVQLQGLAASRALQVQAIDVTPPKKLNGA